jgi:hypothetical protein
MGLSTADMNPAGGMGHLETGTQECGDIKKRKMGRMKACDIVCKFTDRLTVWLMVFVADKLADAILL